MKLYSMVTLGTAGLLLLGSSGCQQFPGTSRQQGAAIGGVGGAVAGAALGGERHRLLGALLGGAAGAGGGYLIGASRDRITHRDSVAAEEAMRAAQATPASPEQARYALTADLNSDGFVTLDEVVAMKRAGVPEQTMIERLRATGQVFELTFEQQQTLRSQGVSEYVLRQMMDVNRDIRDSLVEGQTGIISRPPGQ